MERFRSALEKGNLSDLGWRGNKFTWSNKHEDDTFTKERLDRAVAIPRWAHLHKDYWVEVLAGRCSDHRPLLLFSSKKGRNIWRSKKVFRYEAGWAKDEECEGVIRREWDRREERGEQPINFMNLLDNCSKALGMWNNQNKVNRVKVIKEKQNTLRSYKMMRGGTTQQRLKGCKERLGVCWRRKT
ncbi:hypothetical protein F2P56_016794 [Juglans regia]|uniref:Uncharacterized protein LOC108992556 n=2 Tax=Juglans regia TaxID=51240 RepID=A0A2I4ETH5_JUGRE|nr:uncharacterized protein LOC108992556 [Juglans regia]KAF5466912.1 hypothetical protein F2P56_016794 [Juglans regia]